VLIRTHHQALFYHTSLETKILRAGITEKHNFPVWELFEYYIELPHLKDLHIQRVLCLQQGIRCQSINIQVKDATVIYCT